MHNTQPHKLCDVCVRTPHTRCVWPPYHMCPPPHPARACSDHSRWLIQHVMRGGSPGTAGAPSQPTHTQAPPQKLVISHPTMPPTANHTPSCTPHHPTQLPNDDGARGWAGYCAMALNYTRIQCSAHPAVVGGETGPARVVPQGSTCRCPPPVPIRCQHAPGGFGGVRPRPRSVLVAGGPCPCVVGCQKNARVCLGSAGCAPERGIWGGQTGQPHHTHRQDHHKHWGGWWGARPCPWHRAGPTSVGPQGLSRRLKAREKQRLEGKRPGARSPPCGGRSRPPFQAHTAHHLPNLNAGFQGLGAD